MNSFGQDMKFDNMVSHNTTLQSVNGQFQPKSDYILFPKPKDYSNLQSVTQERGSRTQRDHE